MVSADAALLELLQRLKELDYRFTTVTPATHRRVLSRPLSGAPNLRDIFGWNRAFPAAALPPDLLKLMEQADLVEPHGDKLKSKVRVASLGDDLFAHSAYPTESSESVFFGPDTYRFARFIQAQLLRMSAVRSIVDMGAGSGAGAIVAARIRPAAEITLVDLNPEALRLAAINAAAANVEINIVRADQVQAGDLVIANPPYMMDAARRAYRDGGDLYGGAVALDWTRRALANGSTMLLYTGAAVVSGRMPLIEALRREAAAIAFEEIDPDVFGEELEQPAYAEVERIAVLGVTITPAPQPVLA